MTPRLIRALAMCGLIGLAALSAFSALTSARALPDGRSASNQAIERRLARGCRHRYELRLAGGEFAHISVEQKGIDVLAQVSDPGGRPIAEFDDQPGGRGQEEISLVADTAGVYTFTISTSSTASHGSYVIRVERRRLATDADRAWQQSRRLRSDAARFSTAGRFDEARRLLDRAMTFAIDAREPGDRDIGLLSLQLAYNALAMRDDGRARGLATRAAEVFDQPGRRDDLFAARARSLLAILDEHAGDGAKAEAAVQESLALFERTLGSDHLWSIECLITMASLRFDAGDFDAAEKLNRRAMAMLEASGDTHGISYTALLNNLGQVFQQKGDYAQAEELFLRSLATAERLEGARSYRVTTTLQNLGIIARQRGDYAKALDYDTRALFIREELLGPEHADIAPLLNNLAVVYRSWGDEAHALPMLFRALAIRERTVGPYHRGTLTTVGNIARSYASTGDVAHAVEFERRADAIVEMQLALNLAAGSERQKLAFVRSVAERTDRAISLHLNRARTDPDAAALGALVLLQRKGRVQDSMAEVFDAVRSRVTDVADRVDMDRLNETRRRLAQAALNGAVGAATRKERQTFAALEAEAERLEASLSAHSAEYRAQTQTTSLEAVQEALPPDTALIEYAVFRPFHPDAPKRADEYDPPRYAAYVIRRGSGPVGFDLGDARTIEPAVEALRDTLHDSTTDEADVKTRAAAVFDLILRPLETMLSGASRLVVSPDGHLNLVPFEALVGDNGRYVVEMYATSYVTSGRDLLRMRVPRGAPTEPVIVADPRFGEAAAGTAGAQRRSATSQSVTTGTTLALAYFSPLAATGSEARAINALFPQARLLTGTAATKENVRRVRAPRILHIASHGFFLDDAPAAAARTATNPLLRSGLALAGANGTPDGQANGVLTALEASGLDLWGTELVTLSACDTGVGEIRNGEGVYGLRRAFVLAGAQSLVMSLWPVSDYLARDTMVAYYTGLRSGLGRGDALRQAKLAILKQAGRRHPYYWAGFIQSGQWTPLLHDGGDHAAAGPMPMPRRRRSPSAERGRGPDVDQARSGSGRF